MLIAASRSGNEHGWWGRLKTPEGQKVGQFQSAVDMVGKHMQITSRQSRAARALLGWGISEASEASGVNQRSNSNFEGDRSGLAGVSMKALVPAYEDGGIEFLEGRARLNRD